MMSYPIISTKIRMSPPRNDLVPRPELEERLSRSESSKLVLVSAPPGFGKTTLLSSWLSSQKIPFAWLSLDEEDNTPLRYTTYLTAACRIQEPEGEQALLSSLLSPKPPAPGAVLPYLIEYLTSLSSFIIVLDDYHLISNSEVHRLTDCLLKHLPPNIRMIISSRVDPPLHLSLLRGRDQLTEIRASELRFSDTEADSFLNISRNLGLSQQDICLLNKKAEGWISGLQMAALSIRGRTDRHGFVQSFSGSNRFILDYLLEEVLSRQPAEIQSFMLKTSILPRFTSELCCWVTGNEDSAETIERMERANHFVTALDDNRRWFRYHHLFADLLQHRLSTDDSVDIVELHRRASTWYEKNGLLNDAVEHALQAEDWHNALNLIRIHAESMWEYNDQNHLPRWLSRIPVQEIRLPPDIIIHHGFSLCFSGQYKEADKEMTDLISDIKNISPEILGKTSTVRAFSALYRNEIENAARFSKTALKYLPKEEHNWKALCLSIHGDVLVYSGHIPTYEKIWREAVKEAELAGNSFFRLHAATKLMVAGRRMGKLLESAELYRRETGKVFNSGPPPSAIPGAMESVFGEILLEWNKLEEGLEYIKRGLSLSQRQGYSAGVAWSLISLIKAYFYMGMFDLSKETVATIEDQINRSALPAWTKNWLNAWKIRLYVHDGRFEKAESIICESGLKQDSPIRYPQEVEYIAYIKYLIARDASLPGDGYLTEAFKIISSLSEHLKRQNWIDKLLETEILKVLALAQIGEKDTATDSLAGIINRAEPQEYTRLFIDNGKKLAPLLFSVQQKCKSKSYIKNILSWIPPEQLNQAEAKQKELLLEPLSEREIEILQNLAEGCSNKELASALFISTGTVKNHLKHIYGKLNVHSRTQAAAKGRGLGLIK